MESDQVCAIVDTGRAAFFNVKQDPQIINTASKVIPCLLQGSLHWSTTAERWLTAKEALRVHFVPMSASDIAGTLHKEEPYRFDAGFQPSGFQLRTLAGNGMCNPTA